MLQSIDPCVSGKRPVFAAWFGNFFEPYFSNPEAVEKGLKDLKSLGMNSIVLDSKLWSDFTRYFKTGELSQYVGMQKTIQEQCQKEGLGLSFLALFAIGDNLYPEIYDHPPEYVEQPVDFWQKPFRGYRHWSIKQTEEHVRHSLDLYRKIAGDTAAKALDDEGRVRLPFYFYHSPIFAPSFDEEGRTFYLNWLKTQYCLTEVNARYGTAFGAIEQMAPADYWVHPDAADEDARYVPSAEDYRENTPVLLKHADNRRFKHQVMRDYFRELIERLRKEDPRFYFYAGLSQWKYFFNDFIHIENRGWDLWDLGKIFDSPTFITMPVDSNGDIDPYVVPCELSMLRSAADDKDFVAALFIGRYMSNDLYSVCSPAEVLASTLGAGGTDLYFYGYNGLDDGGNFEKWPAEQKTSLKQGLDWFSEVREKAGRRIKTHEAAILFPYASYCLCAHATDPKRYTAFRGDLLGWFRQLSDHGINPDILHPFQVKEGQLDRYKILVLPADPLYEAMRDVAMEAALRRFVENGGTLLHSVSELAEQAFDFGSQTHKPDSFQWEEKVVTGSGSFVSYPEANPEAVYMSDGTCAYSIRERGKGRIHSFGFDYGFGYASKEHLPVAREYKKDNHYPLSVIARTPVDKLLADLELSKGRQRGVETLPFEKGHLVINHTPYTVKVPAGSAYVSTFEGFDGCHLPGRHAVFVGSFS
jgi:hypothetical protein